MLNDLLDLSKIEAGKLELEDGDVRPRARSPPARSGASARWPTTRAWPSSSTSAAEASGCWRGDPTRRAPDPLQPGLQRPEVHRTRGAGPRRRRPRQRGPALTVSRHRHRHSRRTPGRPVREVRPGRRLHHPPVRRHRPWPGDLPRAGRADGRRDRRPRAARARARPSPSTCRWRVRRRAGRAGRAPKQTRGAGDDRRLRVLAAEDNPINQLVLAHPAGQLGVELVLVATAPRPSRPGSAGDWDLILMDVQMPVMDGLTAATGDPRTRSGARAAAHADHRADRQRHGPS